MTQLYQSLSHSKWDCKYHVIFVPKYRLMVIFGEIRKFLGPIFQEKSKAEGVPNSGGAFNARACAGCVLKFHPNMLCHR